MTREEKKLAEQRLWELERVHKERQEKLRQDTESRAIVCVLCLLYLWGKYGVINNKCKWFDTIEYTATPL